VESYQQKSTFSEDNILAPSDAALPDFYMH